MDDVSQISSQLKSVKQECNVQISFIYFPNYPSFDLMQLLHNYNMYVVPN